MREACYEMSGHIKTVHVRLSINAYVIQSGHACYGYFSERPPFIQPGVVTPLIGWSKLQAVHQIISNLTQPNRMTSWVAEETSD